jgi:hypothetical protein
MATIIKIKRTTGATAPSGLNQGELAYVYDTSATNAGAGGNGYRLFIGDPTSTSNSAIEIGGRYYTQLLDHTPGTLTASSSIITDSNNAIDDLYVGNNATTGGSIKFNEGTNNGSNYIALKSPNSVTSNVTYTLPSTYSSGQFLTIDGSGNMSFAAVPSGSFTISDGSNTDTFTTGQTLTFTGGTGIDTTVSNNEVTYAIDSTVATASSTHTFTNKTFDANGTGNSLSNVEVADFAGSAIVLESEGISSNDNDTTLPTSAAVKDYVDTQVSGVASCDFTPTSSNTNIVINDSQNTTMTGTNNTVVGNYAGCSLTTGAFNTLIGASTGRYITTGGANIGVGQNAGKITDGCRNITMGNTSFMCASSGLDNITVGTYSASYLGQNVTSKGNVVIGNSAGKFTSTSNYNIAIGYKSAYSTYVSNTGFCGNITMGQESGNSKNNNNITIGQFAGFANGSGMSGNNNIGIGTHVFCSSGMSISAYSNTAIGGYAMTSISSGQANTGVGSNALNAITSGNDNTSIGANSGTYISTGSCNLNLGRFANAGFLGGTTTGNNNIVIGYSAAPSSQGASNEITLGNTTHNLLRIPGISTTSGKLLVHNGSGFVEGDIDADSTTVSNIEVDNFKASAIVTEGEGISSNDNDTTIPTSAAVKDYVDNSVTAQDLDFQGDSGGALSIDLDSETLTIAGGTGISTSGATNTLTVAIDSTVATLTGSQTLTNKTVNLTNNTLTGTTAEFNAALSDGDFATLAGTETLTNKTLTSPDINGGSFDGGTIGTGSAVTEAQIDNLNINGNTISSTNTNGNITINPDGTGTVDVSSARITNLAEPTADSDAATKSYVDAVAEGLHVHEQVHAYIDTPLATITGNTVTYSNGTSGVGATLTLSTALDIAGGDLDGDTDITTGDRIIIAGESTAAHNGIYVLTSTTVLTRATDFDTPTEMAGGDFVWVTHGSTYADTGWVLGEAVGTVGTDDVTFVQFSGLGQITAGDGLTKSGNTLNVVGTTNRITANANSIDIAATYVGQTSITTLGTIATGTWNATEIGEVYGGTGQTSYTTGDILYASASNTLAKLSLGADGKILQSNGTNVEYGDLDGGTY